MPDWKKRLAKQMRRKPTKAEKILWKRLRLKRLDGLKFRQQAPMLGYIVDFYCPKLKLVIELDGLVHMNRKKEDAARDKVMQEYGLKVMRIPNGMIYRDLSFVLQRIRDFNTAL